MRRATVRAVSVVTLGMAPVLPCRAAAQGHIWRLETRFLVSDAGNVVAVAAGPTEVWALTPTSVLVHDPIAERWKLPITLPTEAVRAGPSTLAFDPAGGILWIGTSSGDLYSITPGIDRWDRIPGAATGAIDRLVVSRREAAVYFESRRVWHRIASGSFFPEAVPAAEVPPDVTATSSAERDPFLAAAAGTLGQDGRGRSWRLTSVASGPDAGLYWIGTDGGGVVRFDSRSNRRQLLRFGLAGSGVGAIYRSSDALWFGGYGRDPRSGVAHASLDLGQWRQLERPEAAPAGFVAEIVTAFGRLWFASSDGLFSMDPSRLESRRPFDRANVDRELPSREVRSLLADGPRLWVGTDAGLIALDSTGRVMERMFAGSRVSRMARSDNNILAATDAGLRSISVEGPAGAVVTNASPDPTLTGRVTDVIATPAGAFAVAGGRIHAVGPVPSALRDAALESLGPVLRLAWTDGHLWVAAEGGIAVRDEDGRWETFRVPADIPVGPVVDVLAAGDDVWAATPAGAWRLRWR